jgi:hypothetical protein
LRLLFFAALVVAAYRARANRHSGPTEDQLSVQSLVAPLLPIWADRLAALIAATCFSTFAGSFTQLLDFFHRNGHTLSSVDLLP